jgi:hypothetical protein
MQSSPKNGKQALMLEMEGSKEYVSIASGVYVLLLCIEAVKGAPCVNRDFLSVQPFSVGVADCGGGRRLLPDIAPTGI